MPKEIVYTTDTTWVNESEHMLLVACSDPRFQEGTSEFIVKRLNIHRFDQLILPGGPANVLLSAPYFFAARSQIAMLHKLHSFKHVIGIAHYDCGYYKLKYPESDETIRFNRQTADLYKFGKEVKKITPEAVVELYFAEPAEGVIRFIKVKEE